MIIYKSESCEPLLAQLHVFHDAVDVVDVLLVLNLHVFPIEPGCLVGNLLQQHLTLLPQALQRSL